MLPERLRYHDPLLDTATYDQRVRQSGRPMEKPGPGKPANLVSSLCDDGLHRPVLDIDTTVRLVPSSTPGHGHLYFDDVAMTWEEYSRLLDLLAGVGLVDRDWVAHCKAKGQSTVRLPISRKWGADDDWWDDLLFAYELAQLDSLCDRVMR